MCPFSTYLLSLCFDQLHLARLKKNSRKFLRKYGCFILGAGSCTIPFGNVQLWLQWKPQTHNICLYDFLLTFTSRVPHPLAHFESWINFHIWAEGLKKSDSHFKAFSQQPSNFSSLVWLHKKYRKGGKSSPVCRYPVLVWLLWILHWANNASLSIPTHYLIWDNFVKTGVRVEEETPARRWGLEFIFTLEF